MYNNRDRAADVAVRFDLAGVGWDGAATGLEVDELLESRAVRRPPDPGRDLLGRLTVKPREALILRLRRPKR